MSSKGQVGLKNKAKVPYKVGSKRGSVFKLNYQLNNLRAQINMFAA